MFNKLLKIGMAPILVALLLPLRSGGRIVRRGSNRNPARADHGAPGL